MHIPQGVGRRREILSSKRDFFLMRDSLCRPVRVASPDFGRVSDRYYIERLMFATYTEVTPNWVMSGLATTRSELRKDCTARAQ
jgi:hypothetical protein